MAYKKKLCIVLALLLTTSFSACTSKNENGNNDLNQQENNTQTHNTVYDSDMFTDRDMDNSCDTDKAIKIALADNASECNSNIVNIDGNTITITDEGTFLLSGSLTNGQVIINAEKTDKLQIVLDGVAISCGNSAPIYVKKADKVFVTLAAGSENTLSVTGDYVAIDDNNIDAAIFSKDDITFNGKGSLIINASYGHGIVSKDDLVFTGGTYHITSADHGLSANDSIRIADGDFRIEAVEDGLHSDNDEDEDLGYIYIANGNFQIAVGDDGIHASSGIVINNGTIDITESYEGIEGHSIEINGGNISVVSSDDGLNAAGGSGESDFAGGRINNFDGGRMGAFDLDEDAYIYINGGTIYIDAEGDGIDSNGNMTVTGGEIYIAGPESNGDGALDYSGEGVIIGGTVVALGQNGMAMNFGNNSTQGSIMVTLSGQATGEVRLTDDAGNVLVSFSTYKKYNSVVISCPEIVQGATYHIEANGQTTDVEMTSLIYGSNGGMGGMMPGGQGRPNDGTIPSGPGGMPNDGTFPESMPNDGSMPGNGGFRGDENMPDGGGFRGGRGDGQMPDGEAFPGDMPNDGTMFDSNQLRDDSREN